MVIILSVLLPLGFIINRTITNFYITKTEAEIEALSQKYADTIPSLNDTDVLSMFYGLSDLTNNEIVIIDKNGKDIVNSGINGFQIDPRDLGKLSHGQSITRSYRDVNGKDQFLVSASPIIKKGTMIGAVYVFAPSKEVSHSLTSIRSSLILSGVGALLLSLGFTFFLSRKISQPLLRMEDATKKIAGGDLTARVKIPSSDELGSLGAAINELAIELDRYRKNRSEFFADISHELRTPITYLSGYANVLEHELYKTDKERRHYLKIIGSEAGRLNKLIDDLFDLAKMEEGKIDLNLEQVDIANLLENAMTKAKLEASNKELSVNYQISGKNHLVLGDKFRLGQIFDNLLRNAVRYTEKGHIAVNLEKKGDKEVIYIKDTGPGIPADEIDYIFERFYRVEKSRSRNTGGTGLGLAIVKQLVILHNGQIDVDSILGEGTQFTLTFPRFKGEDTHEMV